MEHPFSRDHRRRCPARRHVLPDAETFHLGPHRRRGEGMTRAVSHSTNEISLMPKLRLSRVSKSYGAFHALKAIDLSVDQGEFIVMVGPSGCGKSTLLKAIAGLEAISSGS